MPGARARTVLALARAVADGRLVLMPNADIEATLERLRALPGVGEWTAQYIAMRALAWPDAFPHTDLGVMKALGETRRAPRAGRGRSVAAVARVRRDASVAITDERNDHALLRFYESPHGQMLLVADGEGAVRRLFRGPEISSAIDAGMAAGCAHMRRCARRSASWRNTSPASASVSRSRSRREGTPFQRAVWKAISTVGFGETITYGELARRAGCPGSVRAAGAATGRNPISDHRSLPPHRRLERQPHGICGRSRRKRALLALEEHALP